jgi:hypothetical protein
MPDNDFLFMKLAIGLFLENVKKEDAPLVH